MKVPLEARIAEDQQKADRIQARLERMDETIRELRDDTRATDELFARVMGLPLSPPR